MSIRMKFWFATITIVAVAFVGLVHLAPSDNVDCSKLDQVLDEQLLAQSITFRKDKFEFITSPETMLKYCNRANEAIKTLRRYNRECHKNLTQQIVGSMLKTRGQYVERVCKPDSDDFKKEVEGLTCAFNIPTSLEDEQKVMRQMQAVVDANIEDDKLRARRTCCTILDCQKTSLSTYREKCPSTVESFASYLDSYTSESMSFVCQDGKNLECDKLEPLKVGSGEPKLHYLTNVVNLIRTLDH